jgi:hypothetical protein
MMIDKDEALTTQMAKFEAAIEKLKNDNSQIEHLNNTFQKQNIILNELQSYMNQTVE